MEQMDSSVSNKNQTEGLWVLLKSLTHSLETCRLKHSRTCSRLGPRQVNLIKVLQFLLCLDEGDREDAHRLVGSSVRQLLRGIKDLERSEGLLT